MNPPTGPTRQNRSTPSPRAIPSASTDARRPGLRAGAVDAATPTLIASGSRRGVGGTRVSDPSVNPRSGSTPPITVCDSVRLLPLDHPTLAELIRRGLRLSAHVYLRQGKLSLCLMANDPITRKTYHGRSRRGNLAEAIEHLERNVSR